VIEVLIVFLFVYIFIRDIKQRGTIAKFNLQVKIQERENKIFRAEIEGIKDELKKYEDADQDEKMAPVIPLRVVDLGDLPAS
jgi:cell division protein FtsB